MSGNGYANEYEVEGDYVKQKFNGSSNGYQKLIRCRDSKLIYTEPDEADPEKKNCISTGRTELTIKIEQKQLTNKEWDALPYSAANIPPFRNRCKPFGEPTYDIIIVKNGKKTEYKIVDNIATIFENEIPTAIHWVTHVNDSIEMDFDDDIEVTGYSTITLTIEMIEFTYSNLEEIGKYIHEALGHF